MTDEDWENFDLRRFIEHTIEHANYGEDLHGQLEMRVMRLEEIAAARWPRSILVRWRLAREIRTTAAAFPDEYIPRRDFIGRRLEAVSQAMMIEEEGRERRQAARREAVEREQPPGGGPGTGFLP